MRLDQQRMKEAPKPVTLLLQSVMDGDEGASEQLLTAVYAELRQIARTRLRQLPPGQTLQPTALVNEAYLRLVDKDQQDWQGRRHFFFTAARAMHDVLVEEARKKAAKKRGGEWRRLGPGALTVATEAEPEHLLALDEALKILELQSPEQARLVRLRFFVGLTEAETAAVLETPLRSVQRQWRMARARLYAELAEE